MTRIAKNIRNHKAMAGTALIVMLLGGGFSIYHSSSASADAPAASAAPMAVPVVVQTLAEQNIRTWSEFSGRLHAVDSAEIRPEVSGRITAVKFSDGQNVKAGDVLIVIDPQPYEAAVAKAEADVDTARTNADFAKTELDRAAGLIKSQAIAQRLYDERANSARVADASIAAAEAELKKAKIDLDHAYVKAPIGGRVSRAELTVGNVVQAGPTAPVLTTVVSNKSIYADFEVDEQTYMQSMRTPATGTDNDNKIPVVLTVLGDEAHPYTGTIESFDNRIDTASGTIRARAKFDNTDGILMPGMTISVKVGSMNDTRGLLVPERALNNDQSKQFVYVVGPGNKVVYRAVELGKKVDVQRVVISGLAAGDRVIVDGIQHVHPDVVVDPKEVTAAAAPATPDQPTAVQPAAGGPAKQPDQSVAVNK